MSLQVWLPMTKDLRQQGLSDVEVTNNGATFNSVGKLGGCYSFDGNDDYLSFSINNIITANSAFSVVAWVNKISGNSYYPIFHFGNGTPNASGVSGVALHGNCNRLEGSDGTHVFDKSFSTIVTSDSWIHVALIYDGNNIKYYCNGELKQTAEWSYGFGTQTTIRIGAFWGAKYKGYLNDVRIYDHALSLMEVKQISRGLVLHYPLNRNGFGQENLINTFDSSFLSYTDGAVTLFYNQMNNGTQEIVSNITGAEKCLHLHCNSGGNNRQYTTFNLYIGKTYTISADYYSNQKQNTAWCGELQGGDYSWLRNYTSYTTPGKWQRLSYTYENLTSNATLYMFVYCTAGQDCYVKNIKIEEGSIATPWCPNSSDTLATAIDLNGTTEYDCSGFCNNGTRTGTFSWTSDTPRYQVSINIPDGAYVNTNYKENIGIGDFTVSVWIKMPQTSGKTYQPIFSNKTTGAASVGFAIYFNQNQNKLLWSTADGSASTEIWTANTVNIYNKWTHIVMIRNSSDAKKGYFYINGERYELASVPVIRNITNETYSIQIGDIATHNNSNYRYVGLISDFRIYATALSADDVRALYENSAYIDNSGNTYAATYTEV